MPSLIESQKLMKFLPEAGEPLRLQFAKHLYGPYADNLRHVLASSRATTSLATAMALRQCTMPSP